MNHQPFIRIGTRILAVAHIAAIGKTPEGKVNIQMAGEDDYVSFTGAQATVVWDWASAMLRCHDLTVIPQSADIQ